MLHTEIRMWWQVNASYSRSDSASDAKKHRLGYTCFGDNPSGNVGSFLASNGPQKTANVQ